MILKNMEAESFDIGDAATALTGGDSEFWNQFVANVLLIVAVGCFLGIKKLCNRDSKCKSHIHCCCIDFDVRDRTTRERPETTDEDGPSVV